jgi:glycosyltransferase involved in cell wall biosynthesis
MNDNVTISTSEERLATDEYLTLSIIIPVHNEEKILKEQTLRLVKYAQQLRVTFEILFVENGSIDKTLNTVEKLQRRFRFIRLIKLGKADYSTAVIEGVKKAKGKYSIVMGIDFVDIEVLDRCLHALKGSDIVICSKNLGLDKRPLLNRQANRCYNALVRVLFGLKYSDVEGYHGYNTKKIQALVADIRTRVHLCNLWVLIKAREAGLKVNETPFIVYERRKSKFMKFTRLPYLAAISLIEFVKLKCKGY